MEILVALNLPLQFELKDFLERACLLFFSRHACISLSVCSQDLPERGISLYFVARCYVVTNFISVCSDPIAGKFRDCKDFCLML